MASSRRRRRPAARSTEPPAAEPAGPPSWSTACPDWAERIVARRSLIPFEPLFRAQAEAALEVFRELKIVDVAGSPTAGEVCREWIFDFVGAVFGAYDHAAGRRLIRNFLLSVSKKNWKSGLAAGLMVTALVRNWRLSGEFIILAPTIEVAQNSFKPARDMISSSEELSAILHAQPSIRTITHRGTGATLKVVAADSQTVSGKKAIGVLVDELWQFGLMHDAEDMLREATGGLASRPEGFVIYLTTQSDKPPAGIFAKRLQYFRKVRDGEVVDPRSLPVLYEFPEAMLKSKAYREEANWYVTNPNLGASVDLEFLRERHAVDEVGGEASLLGFYAKHLNVEVGVAQAIDNWAGARYWDQNVERVATLEELLDRCEVATAGADGGGLDDLYGFAVIGRTAEGRWLLWAHAWCHAGVLERRKEIAPRLLDFQADGDLTIVARIGDDVVQIADLLQQIRDAGKFPDEAAIGVDPVGIAALLDELGNRGFSTSTADAAGMIEGVPQGWQLQGAIKTVERKLAGGELVHSGSRLMAWCVGNAKIEPRANGMLVTKQASGFAKIDPLMATFNAAALMSKNPQVGGRGIFEFYKNTAAAGRPRADGAPAVSKQPAQIALRAPPGTSNVYGITGKQYVVAADGIVRVDEDDEKPLIGQGFERIVMAET